MTGWTRYGHYRYGHSEYRERDRVTPRREIDRGLTPEELFGAGVALRTADDPEGVSWDFVADATGDLAATVGEDELRKDMAFQTARDARSLIGTLSTANDYARLETDIEQIGRQDTRVERVDARVEESRVYRNQVNARVAVDAETQTMPNMVFPLEK